MTWSRLGRALIIPGAVLAAGSLIGLTGSVPLPVALIVAEYIAISVAGPRPLGGRSARAGAGLFAIGLLFTAASVANSKGDADLPVLFFGSIVAPAGLLLLGTSLARAPGLRRVVGILLIVSIVGIFAAAIVGSSSWGSAVRSMGLALVLIGCAGVGLVAWAVGPFRRTENEVAVRRLAGAGASSPALTRVGAGSGSLIVGSAAFALTWAIASTMAHFGLGPPDPHSVAVLAAIALIGAGGAAASAALMDRGDHLIAALRIVAIAGLGAPVAAIVTVPDHVAAVTTQNTLLSLSLCATVVAIAAAGSRRGNQAITVALAVSLLASIASVGPVVSHWCAPGRICVPTTSMSLTPPAGWYLERYDPVTLKAIGQDQSFTVSGGEYSGTLDDLERQELDHLARDPSLHSFGQSRPPAVASRVDLAFGPAVRIKYTRESAGFLFSVGANYLDVEYALLVDGRSVVIHYEQYAGCCADPGAGVTDPNDLRSLLAALHKG